MTKITKRTAFTLIVVAMFSISILQVFSHYTAVSDMSKGIFTGIGFGMVLIALFAGKFKSCHSN